MNSSCRKITKDFEYMEISDKLNLDAFSLYTSKQHKHLSRLSDRMAYLYDRLLEGRDKNRNYQYHKDEFRALEWIMLDFELLDEKTYRKVDFDQILSDMEDDDLHD